MFSINIEKTPRKTRDEIQPGEVAISNPGLREAAFGTQKDLVHIFKSTFGLDNRDPKKFLNIEYKVLIETVEYIFIARLKGGQAVWTFKNTLTDRLKKLLSQDPLDGWVSVTIGGLRAAGYGTSPNGLDTFKSIFGLGDSDPQKFLDKEHKVRVDGKEFIFVGRRSSGRIVWAFNHNQTSEIKEILNRKKVNSDEIRVSKRGLQDAGIGSNSEVLRRFYSTFNLTDKDPKKFLNKTYQVQIEGKIFVFIGRLHGPTHVWVFRKDVVKEMQEILDRSVRSGEIAVSEQKLAEVGFGRPTDLIKRFRAVFDLNDKDPLDFLNKEYKVIIKDKEFAFIGRFSGTKAVWTFHFSLLPSIARALHANLDLTQAPGFDTPELADVVALLGSDPGRLHNSIKFLHAEILSQTAIDLTIQSIRGLGGQPARFEFPDYEVRLDSPLVTEPLDREVINGKEIVDFVTSEHHFALSGKAPKDAEFIYLEGSYTKRVRVDDSGHFKTYVPLTKTGELHTFFLSSINTEKKICSDFLEIHVRQTSTKIDTEQAYEQLLFAKEEILANIKKDPKRRDFLRQQLEISLLKSFTDEIEKGFASLAKKILDEKAPLRRKLLQEIEKKFLKVSSCELSILPDQKPFFYQKYIYYLVNEAEKAGKKGILIALEQGLGKTLIAQMLAANRNVTVIAPNAVVPTWLTEESKFCPNPTLTAIEGSYQERDELITSNNNPQRKVVNLEFLRKLSEKRRKGLSQPGGLIIIDEAGFLAAKNSQQAAGVRSLQSKFTVLLTATPFARPSQISSILSIINSERIGTASQKDTAKAFNLRDPRDVDALHLMLGENMLRLRKQDVFDQYDKSQALEVQSNRLPEKMRVEPSVETGVFELLAEQCRSILQLIKDYKGWCRDHVCHVSYEDRKHSKLFKDGFFSKREAIRQIMNDPAYIGLPHLASPKHQMTQKVIERELEDSKSKALIFCRYRWQIERYAKLFKKYGARTYYGGLPKNSNGYRVDAEGDILLYEYDQKKRIFISDDQKRPVLTTKGNGKPMLALEYEKYLFQESPTSRIMLLTYDSGSVGITLTAANLVHFDDLAPTFRDEYQAGDRAHRIDNVRKKYEVRYSWAQAKYPDNFLSSIFDTPDWKYFEPGTYDQVMHENLRRQGQIFHRVMDGVGSDEELMEANRELYRKMPFLFTPQDIEESNDELAGDVVGDSELIGGDDSEND